MELHILTETEIKKIDEAKKLVDAIKFLTKYKTLLHLLSVGKSTAEVAKLMYLDYRTIEGIIYRLMKASEAENRVHLVSIAFRLNILKMN